MTLKVVVTRWISTDESLETQVPLSWYLIVFSALAQTEMTGYITTLEAHYGYRLTVSKRENGC